MVSTQELNRRLSLVSECSSIEDLCLKFISAWGGSAQIDTAIEELAELIKELARWEGRGLKDNTYDRLVDEMADVLNVWHQMFELMDLAFDEDVENDIYDRCIFKFLRVYGKLPGDCK